MNFRLNDSIELLSRTPSVLDRWLRGLPEAWLLANEGPESWSPREIVGHLIHGEDTDWIPRARTILEHGEARVFEPFDRFAQQRRFTDASMDRLLDLFAAKRAANLEALAAMRLTRAALEARGRHPEFGPVTLEQLLVAWAVHDLDHIAQIARVMAKRYAGDVGPWIAYLGILRHS